MHTSLQARADSGPGAFGRVAKMVDADCPEGLVEASVGSVVNEANLSVRQSKTAKARTR